MVFKVLLAVALSAAAASAQVFQNLDFSTTSDAYPSGLDGWVVSWASKGVRCEPVTRDGNPALLIAGSGPDGVGFVEQTAHLRDSSVATILTFSARVRSEGVAGRGAGLNIAGYDPAGALTFTQDMGYASLRWIVGDHDWARCTIRAVCPAGTASIKIGAILYGRGSVWFDDCQVATAAIDGRIPTAAGTAYVEAALRLMEQNALNRGRLEIPGLKTTALRIAGSDDPADHHLAVQFLLGQLEDHHSFLMRPDEVALWKQDAAGTEQAAMPEHRIVDGCGYVSVPFFHGSDEDSMRRFAQRIHAALRELDAAGVKGWVIDLRGNTGGNMEPMIAGLGPLLDEGSLGFLVDVRGGRETWAYDRGVYRWQGEAGLTLPEPFVSARRLPIAVLTGPRTGSSGEAVAICFIGNARTRSFGQATWGLTTGNGNFDLPDGARMFMASTTMADRSGRVCTGPIEPDEKVEPGGEGDAALDRAIAWVLGEAKSDHDRER